MNRAARERHGRRAEQAAAWWLRCKGYRILAMRYKTPVGEIDIVARRGNTVVFIEVKGRKRRHDAANAIHARNQARVVRAAQWWLQRHPLFEQSQVRFDACLVAWYRFPHHIPHAFTATM